MAAGAVGLFLLQLLPEEEEGEEAADDAAVLQAAATAAAWPLPAGCNCKVLRGRREDWATLTTTPADECGDARWSARLAGDGAGPLLLLWGYNAQGEGFAAPATAPRPFEAGALRCRCWRLHPARCFFWPPPPPAEEETTTWRWVLPLDDLRRRRRFISRHFSDLQLQLVVQPVGRRGFRLGDEAEVCLRRCRPPTGAVAVRLTVLSTPPTRPAAAGAELPLEPERCSWSLGRFRVASDQTLALGVSRR
jgi:hypothetical protein